ncbi:MAG: hypothetical protein QNJ46_19620 [Leptolyngbyaceae cyanobacterium MO_188.B28]|nr:hypothetical protein [Leptolyngbyaceae cyanobacterium MO_188.B28]
MVKTRLLTVVLMSIAALLGEGDVRASEVVSFEGAVQGELRRERSRSIDLAQVNVASAAELADYFWRRQPISDFSFGQSGADSASLSLLEAADLRDQYVYQLMSKLGSIAGYKAGLTSPAAQARFGVDHPLRGVLLQDMMLESGATVPASFGARPLFEADLIVRVSDAAINQAETSEEALAALDAVIPFIELPDLMFGPNANLDAASLTAVNVGARLGVMGTAIPIDATEEWMTALGNIQVEILDESGAILAEGNSSALLGHPLEVVLWLRDDLKRSGQCLRPGDLLSLGSITAPTPVSDIQILQARYQGLRQNDPVDVVVTFD